MSNAKEQSLLTKSSFHGKQTGINTHALLPRLIKSNMGLKQKLTKWQTPTPELACPEVQYGLSASGPSLKQAKKWVLIPNSSLIRVQTQPRSSKFLELTNERELKSHSQLQTPKKDTISHLYYSDAH